MFKHYKACQSKARNLASSNPLGYCDKCESLNKVTYKVVFGRKILEERLTFGFHVKANCAECESEVALVKTSRAYLDTRFRQFKKDITELTGGNLA